MRACARCLIGLLVLASTAVAQTDAGRSSPPDEDRFLNVRLPNASITTARGVHTDLASIAAARPLLLALVFTRCAGVCSPFLASWRDADRSLSTRAAVEHLVL